MKRKAPLNQYDVYLSSLLQARKFQSGNELSELLTKKFGVTAQNARQIILRSSKVGIIESSKPFTFGKGQYIYLFPGEKLTRQRIMAVAEKHRRAMYNLLQAIDLNHGILSNYEGYKVTAAPMEKGTTKADSLEDILKDLFQLSVLREAKDDRGIKYIIDTEIEDEDEIKSLMSTHYMKMVEDSMFLPDVLRWLQKINLIDNEQVLYRNKKPPSLGAKHNNLLWDAAAYTNTTGINPLPGKKATSIEKKSFVCVDMVINREYNQVDLDGFLHRVQITLNSVKAGTRKVMPIVVYKTISPLVLNRLGVLGFLAFDLGSIFGTKIYQVVESLNILQTETTEYFDGDIGTTVKNALETIRTAGQEDALRTIKGVLFEFLMYPLFRKMYNNAEIIRGKEIATIEEDKKKKYEFDYIIKTSKEIIVIELKGYAGKSEISLGDYQKPNTVKWFFSRTFPVAKSHYDYEAKQGKRITTCFITSAGFRKEALDFFDTIRTGKLKPQHLEIAYNGTQLVELLKEHDFTKEAETIKQYYLNKESNSEIEESEPMDEGFTITPLGKQGDDFIPF